MAVKHCQQSHLIIQRSYQNRELGQVIRIRFKSVEDISSTRKEVRSRSEKAVLDQSEHGADIRESATQQHGRLEIFNSIHNNRADDGTLASQLESIRAGSINEVSLRRPKGIV